MKEWINLVGAIILALYTIWTWSSTVLENVRSLVGEAAAPEWQKHLVIWTIFIHPHSIKNHSAIGQWNHRIWVQCLWMGYSRDQVMMDEGSFFHCDLCDSELVHKIAPISLTGLVLACVDNTIGDLFKSPALVAIDMRKEMADYLIQQSETHIAKTVIEEENPNADNSTHPTDIIEDFLDDFTSTKRNMLSRVSSWLLSERREDKIDDFVQEMEINGFWLLDRRESIAQTLLKNDDFKNEFHCEIKFKDIDELAEHKSQCIFRSLNCTNEGCNARFCAVHKEKHDGTWQLAHSKSCPANRNAQK